MPFLTETLSTSGWFAKIFVVGTSGFFIFLTPLLSVFLTKRYVSRMYYNKEEQRLSAVLFNFWLFEYKLDFKLDDIYVPEYPGPFSTVKSKSTNKSFFIDLNQIDNVTLVEKFLGYDKPFEPKKYIDDEDEPKKE